MRLIEITYLSFAGIILFVNLPDNEHKPWNKNCWIAIWMLVAFALYQIVMIGISPYILFANDVPLGSLHKYVDAGGLEEHYFMKYAGPAILLSSYLVAKISIRKNWSDSKFLLCSMLLTVLIFGCFSVCCLLYHHVYSPLSFIDNQDSIERPLNPKP